MSIRARAATANVAVSRRRSSNCFLAEPLEPRRMLALVDGNTVSVIIIGEGTDLMEDPAFGATTILIGAGKENVDPMPISFELSGTAVNGVDYEPVTTSVVMPPFTLTLNILLRPINDDIPELPENVHVKILPGEGYTVDKADSEIRFADTLASFSGTVYHDVDGDNFPNIPADPVVGGVKITHTYQGNVTTLTAAADGTFSETNFPIDGPDVTHTFTVTSAPGFVVPSSPVTIDVLNNENKILFLPLVEAGANATVSGTAFIDFDRDGSFDPTESDIVTGLMTIRIEDTDGNVVGTTTSDASGLWSVTVPEAELPGSFRVFVESESAVLEPSSTAATNISLAKSEERELSLSLVRKPARLIVHTLEDRDGDKVGDRPLNRRVQLKKIGADLTPNTADDVLVQEQIAGRDGDTEFTIPDAEASAAAQYFVTSTGTGTLLEVVQSDVFPIDVGDTEKTLVYSRSAKIVGKVLFDRDSNGRRSSRDEGLLGYRVQLFKDGVLFRQEGTTSTGVYVFLDLEPGNYTIRCLPPSDDPNPDTLVPTNGPNEQPVTLAPGDDPSIDFMVNGGVAMDFSITPESSDTELAAVPGTRPRLSEPLRLTVSSDAGIRPDISVAYTFKKAGDPAAPEIPVAVDSEFRMPRSFSRSLSIARLALDPSTPPGTYEMFAEATPTGVTDTDPSDNKVSLGTVKYTLGAGSLVSDFSVRRTTFSFSGFDFRMQHTGPGFTRVEPDDDGTGFNVISEGTTIDSRATVTSSTPIENILALSTVGRFTGTFNVTESIGFEAGVSRMRLNGNMDAGFDHNIHIGAGVPETDVWTQRLTQTSFMSDVPVKYFYAHNWDPMGRDTLFTAPGIKEFVIDESFKGRLITDDEEDEPIGLRYALNLTVGNSFESEETVIDGPISRFQVGTIINSNVRTVGTDSGIESFRTTNREGISFANAFISSPRIEEIMLRRVQTDNLGIPFGFTSEVFDLFQYRDEFGDRKVVHPSEEDPVVEDDFQAILQIPYMF